MGSNPAIKRPGFPATPSRHHLPCFPLTLSSFSNESALRGTHPRMASPATLLSQGGHADCPSPGTARPGPTSVLRPLLPGTSPRPPSNRGLLPAAPYSWCDEKEAAPLGRPLSPLLLPGFCERALARPELSDPALPDNTCCVSAPALRARRGGRTLSSRSW